MGRNREVIEIKKYSNRRLYDTSRRSYITLSQVAEMIREGKELRVIDAQTGEDLTRAVMLQIICENKVQQEAFPISFLRQVIQASSQSVRQSIRDFLNSAAQLQRGIQEQVSGIQQQFSDIQHQLAETLRQHTGDPLGSIFSLFSNLTKSLAHFRDDGKLSPPESEERTVEGNAKKGEPSELEKKLNSLERELSERERAEPAQGREQPEGHGVDA